MELFYYKHTPEAGVEYKTWIYRVVHFVRDNDVLGTDVVGWVKLQKPAFVEDSQEAADWYEASNREDMHFIMMEHQACQKWFMQNLNEIICAAKHNKKLAV